LWRSQARKKNALASRPRPHVIHTRGLLASPRLFSQRNCIVKHQTHPAPPLLAGRRLRSCVVPAAGRAGRWSSSRRRPWWWWFGSTTAPATAAAWRRWSARARSGPAAAARCASSPTSSATRSAAFATRRPPSCWYVYVLRAICCLSGGCGEARQLAQPDAGGEPLGSLDLASLPPVLRPVPPCLPPLSFPFASSRFDVSFRFVSSLSARPGPARRGSRIDRRNPTY